MAANIAMSISRKSRRLARNFWPVDTEPIARLIAAASHKENPKILLISTPSEDGNKDVDLMYKTHPGRPEIKKAIGSADIIYVSGGNTFKAMKRWRSPGVDARCLRLANPRPRCPACPPARSAGLLTAARTRFTPTGHSGSGVGAGSRL